MIAVQIRPAVAQDAQAICLLHIKSIRELCAGAYTPKQIDAWIGDRTAAQYEAFLNNAVCLVAEKRGQIAGFAILDPARGELHALYVHPDRVGRGIGSQLLMAIENHARAAGLPEIGLNATLNSVSFYDRHGYARKGPATNEVPGGIALPCMRMAKPLAHVAA